MRHYERTVRQYISRLIRARTRACKPLTRDERQFLVATLRMALQCDAGAWSADRHLVAPMRQLKAMRDRADLAVEHMAEDRWWMSCDPHWGNVADARAT